MTEPFPDVASKLMVRKKPIWRMGAKKGTFFPKNRKKAIV
jgi:hypothetical protein